MKDHELAGVIFAITGIVFILMGYIKLGMINLGIALMIVALPNDT